jgi:hypothetical protein
MRLNANNVYIEINDDTINTNGTHLQGHINCSYDNLTRALGYPLESGFDDYKSDAEWWIRFKDGTVATIYNYKNGKNYMGEQGYNLCDIPQWNVGGRSKEVVERVAFLIKDCQVV